MDCFCLAPLGGGDFDPTPAIRDRQDCTRDSISLAVDHPRGRALENRAPFPGVIDRSLRFAGSALGLVGERDIAGNLHALDGAILPEKRSGLRAAGMPGT